MDRLIAPFSVPVGSADTPPGSGTPQYATDGVPGTTPATIWPAYQYNAFQEELVTCATAAGATLDRTKNNQVLTGLQAFVAKNVQVFIANGTFTPPANVTKVDVELYGSGGGSGGAATTANSVASAGGAGGWAKRICTVTPGTPVTVTVPTGGTAGVGGASPTSGGAGSTASFGAFVSATGGGAGLAANGAIQLTAGGGGSGASGDDNRSGQGGGLGFPTGTGYVSSQGGGTYATPPTAPLYSTVLAHGAAGTFPGGGASGGILGGNGAVGGAAYVIVRW